MAAAEFRCRDQLPLLHNSSAIAVRVGREDTYRIHVVPDEAAACQTLMDELDGRRAAVVTDRTVCGLHCEKLTAVLEEHSRLLGRTEVDPGEAGKNLQTAYRLIDWLAQIGLARRDVLVAVGGGALLDTAGWVASAYMRGVPYVNVPTTLLAQVDAGIGGKVGVDHASAKNLVGAFYQPRAVISCLAYLATLDARHLRSGLAEVVKKAVIASPELFVFLKDNALDLVAGQRQALDTLVRSASAIKCELVSRDPYERDLRRPLNFGHTIGHAVETVTGYSPVLHGEAVAFGMAAAVRIARARKIITVETAGQVIELLRTLNLPVYLDELAAVPEPGAVLSALDKIRQIRDGGLRFVLPVALGETVIADDVADEEILSAISVAHRTGSTPNRERSGMLRWAVDAGGSFTTAIASTGVRWVRGSVNPSSVGAGVARATLLALFQELAQQAGDRPSIGWLATATCDPADAHAELARVAGLARAAGLRGELAVSNDALPWLLAPPLCGRGVVVVCGTGSGFLACDGRGELARVGGHEYLGSDEGSAFDLGLAGLRAAVRAADGRGTPTTLGDRVAQRFSAPVQEVARRLANQAFPKAAVAKLAPVVCDAWLAGDATATSIVGAAVAELVLGMRAARDRAGLTDRWSAAAGGGVLLGCPPLFDELARRVRTDLGAHEVVLITEPASTVLAAVHGCLDCGQLTLPVGLIERGAWRIRLDAPVRAGTLRTQQSESGGRIRLGLCLTAYDGSGLGDALVGARSLGVPVVDLPTDSTSGLIDLTRWADDGDYRASLRAAIRRSGLEVGCVSNSRDAQLLLGPHGPHTDAVASGAPGDKETYALRTALRTIQLTADLGVPHVRLMFGVPDFARWLSWWASKVSWSDNITAWAQAARPVLDAAATHGVTLLLEPHAKQVAYDRPSAEQALAAAAAASAADVRLCVDPANQAAIGHDPVDAVRGWGPILTAVHAKDLQHWNGRGAPGGPGWSRYGPGPAFRFRALGAGNLPWPDIVAALLDEDFAGVLYLEHHDALLPPEQGMSASFRLLRELLPEP